MQKSLLAIGGFILLSGCMMSEEERAKRLEQRAQAEKACLEYQNCTALELFLVEEANERERRRNMSLALSQGLRNMSLAGQQQQAFAQRPRNCMTTPTSFGLQTRCY